MKKITLFLFATLFSALSFAALNPYAYGLSSTLDGTTLTVNYSLNSAATGVSVVILDGAEEVKTVTCDGKTKGSHSVEISTIGLPTNKSLTWKVVVTGNSVASPTKQDDKFSFYLPYGLDCDVDPESDYLGNWYVIEATNGGQNKTGYQSNPFGRGLYAFTATLDPILNNAGTRGFLGGVNPGATETNVNSDYVNFYRVATSGGRVFIGKFRDGHAAIVEANPANLNNAFTEVLNDGKRAISIDACGNGKDLKLVMLGTDYKFYEYDLGTAESIAAESRIIDKGTLSIVRNDATITYDNEGGVWFNQNRGTATATCPTIAHISANKGFDYNNISDNVAHNNTNNSGIAVSPDGKQLAVVGAGTKTLTIYNISKTDGQISLTKAHTISTAGSNHTALSWDYAGNLYVANRSAETIQFYAMPYSGTVSTPCASKYAFEVEEIVANVYTLTTNVVGEGTIEGNEGSYVEGTTATLTATPAAHYDFLNWTYGSETSTANPLTITVNSDLTVTANFQEHTKYTITASAANNAMGYVTGGGTYYAGETVTLKAVAKTGYYFTGWSDSNTENPRTFTATEDLTLQANFAKAYPRVYAYDLNVVDNGDSYTFSFKPNTDAISGNLLLYSEDGTSVIQTHAITTAIVAHTTTTITLNKEELPNPADIPWAIELSGNAIPTFAEAFADSDLRYARAHAVVDNSPESEYFGRIYVADRRQTTSNSKVYVYNPDFTDLTATNLGLATAGYSRPAVGADGTLYLTGYTDGAEAGIFVVDPADLTKCTQFFNGTYDSDGLYKNNGKEIGSSTSGVGVYGAGKDAVLYTMMEDGSNANFNSGKQPIVKYQIGQANGTVLKQWSDEPTWLVNYPAKAADKSYNFGNNDFAATAKGVWVSQNKSNPADRPEIAFVDKTGTIQFMQNSNKCLGGGMTVNADNTVLYIVEDSKILEYAIDWNENTPSLTLSKSYPISLTNVSTLSMDYAGNLIACAGTSYSTTDDNKMKVVCFTIPTNNNHSIVPAAKTKAIKLGARYTVTVVVNDESMGEVIGAGSYKEGETVELAAAPVANHRIVDWKKGEEVLSTSLTCSFEVTEDVTINVTFEKIPQYTVTTIASPAGKGSITGGGLYNEGTNVTLTATAHTGYTFVKWEDDETAAATRTITVTGDITYTAIFDKVVPRAWAYDLNVTEEGEDYKFSFMATTAGEATLLFKDDEGNEVVSSHSLGLVDAGAHTISLPKSTFTGIEVDVYWYVKIEGEAITKMAEVTDPTQGIYNFVCPQGIAVDNNPYSEYFGQIYVAAATDGTTDRGAQTRGIFVYNQALEELNTPNAGYLPSNATLTNTSRQAIHRVAVNPVNGQVTFAYNVSGSSAVWSMNPKNLADDAVNLIEGSGITKANSLCFDEDGTLYVMDNANTTTGGNIYKIQNGEANMFATAQKGYHWGVEENAMSPDGRGGLWIAQNRWQVDGYPVLSHIDKNGVVDFAVTSSSPEALKALFPNDDNNASYRGQCAYYVADDILAFAGNKEAVLFKVTYDANNTPTNLEKLMSTGKLGTNIDGVAFDYAGDLYVASETTHRFYKFVVPTNDNTCTVPARQKVINNVKLYDDVNNEDILSALNDNLTENVAIYRSLTGGMYNTLCLPFNVNDLTGTPLENATVWQYNGATVKGDGTSKEIFLDFAEVTSITAGEPYLVEPAEDIAAPMEFKNVTISVTNGSEIAPHTAVTMHGILHPTELQANNKSILFLVENNNLAWANETANMNGMRAYFKVNEPSLLSARTRAYIRREPTVATDMEAITTSETEIKKVIYNGTLYIIRGDEVYTIQGTKVK